MTASNACPGMEAWRRFHAGDVGDAELESLATHQEACESCRALLASLDAQPRGEDATTVDDRSAGGARPDAGGAAMAAVEGFDVEAVLGEGGMGRIWEARDGEVGRQVALKQLKPGHEADPALRERFLAEARITGQLEHPGIVPVYRVIERPDGSPAYSMRLVRGKTLQQAVREYQAKTSGQGDRLALRELLGAFVSVCQTLAYAHSRGVIHRDLKGENVILGPFGEVLVLDWGLAKVRGAPDGPAIRPLPEGAPEATAQGAVVGTPAYLPPEQARGEPADERSDVFGLGAVLYLILTGRPPYVAADRFEVLLLAAEAKVTPPRRLARGVPRALEAVCLKAMQKEPARRYQSAADLAEEVKRWLAGEPVAAYPEPVLVRAGRWVKRRRVTAGSLAAGLLVALIAGGWFVAEDLSRLRNLEARLASAEGHVEEARQTDPTTPKAKVRLSRGLGDVEGAEALLRPWDRASLRRRVEGALIELRQAERDREMVTVRLEEARLEGAKVVRRPEFGLRVGFDVRQVARKYREAFAWYLNVADPLELSAEEAAERLKGRGIAVELIAALDDYSRKAKTEEEQDWARGVASRLDDDPLRSEIRELLKKGDVPALAKLARSADLEGQAAASLALLGRELIVGGQAEAAERVLRLGQRTYPGDFWLNHDLGICLQQVKPAKTDEAVRYLTAALALRSESPGVHLNLGSALGRQKRHKEAEQACRDAIRLKPDYAEAYAYLGDLLRGQKRHREAEQACRDAIRIRPDVVAGHVSLGIALAEQGRHKEAEQVCHDALRLLPDSSEAHNNLGAVLCDYLHRPKEAEQAFRDAIRIKPDYVEAHANLGVALLRQGKHKEAEQACHDAIRLEPDSAHAHYILANALNGQKRYEEAEQACRDAIRRWPDSAEAHSNLGHALNGQKRHKEAEQACRDAVRLQPDSADAHYSLGNVLDDQGRPKEAEEAFRDAIRLEPDLAEAHSNLGNALMSQKRHKEAEQAYRDAIRIQPDHASAHSNLGVALLRQGKHKEAEQACRDAIKLKPKSAAAHSNLGLAWEGQGRYKEAEQACREAIRFQPDSADAHRSLGIVLANQGKHKEAEQACRDAIRLKPDYAEGHFGLGQALSGQKRYKEAEQPYRDAIRLQPAFAEAHANLGAVLNDQKRYKEAEQACRDAIRLEPDLTPAYNILGNALSGQKRHKEAEQAYRDAIRIEPDSAKAHANLGVVLFAESRYKEAEGAYRDAIRLEPDYAEAHLNLGAVLCDHLQKPKEAEQAFRNVIRLKADDAEAHYNLGNALRGQKKQKEAEQAYRDAIRLKPDHAGAHFNLGLALAGQGRPKEAEQAYRDAIRLKLDHADVHDSLGVVLAHQGKHKEAEQAYRNAIKLQPEYVDAYFNLGRLLFEQKRYKEAEQVCRAAIKIQPDNAWAQQNLGVVLENQGKHKEAEQAYRDAIKAQPDYANAHYSLGAALLRQGKFKEALVPFRRCATLFPGGSQGRQFAQQAITETEYQIELDDKLTDVLAGKARPASHPERLELANLAQQPYRAYYAKAVSLYAEALAARPELEARYRFAAARAAALAGTGQGKDTGKLDANDLANLRYSALNRLQGSLSMHAAQLAGDDPKAAEASRQFLLGWQRRDDLAAVRDPDLLAKLPEAERTAWRNLWAYVDTLLARHKPAR